MTSFNSIKTKDGLIHYAKSGHGKQTLIMIHGNSVDYQTWNQFLNDSYWCKKYTMYAFDLPGHGKSYSFNKTNYSIKSVATVLFEAINLLNLSEYDLIGHSLGSHISLALSAMRAPKNLYLLQCGPADSVGTAVSYFNPNAENAFFFSPVVSKEELQQLLAILTLNTKQNSILENAFTISDCQFRSQIGASFALFPDLNEIQFIKTGNTKVFLILSEQDKFLNLTAIQNDFEQKDYCKLIKFSSHGHYAHFDDFKKWNSNFLKHFDL